MSTPAADFDWEAFLDVAVELVQRSGDAGAERSAISRAYYAAFHRASGYVHQRGVHLTFTGRDHALVWDWFFGPNADHALHWVGNAGSLLRRTRRHADYDPAPLPNGSIAAQRSVLLARRIVLELSPTG